MSISNLYSEAVRLASDPSQTRWLFPLLFLADAALTALIILKVPYTEIDFTTYMQHVRIFLKGARDYTLLDGPTGPCVYPAGYVYIYSALYKISDEGTNIGRMQWVFAGLYLVTLGLVGWVYQRCGAPPYLFPLLVLSKRLHSIFVLRLFNDCFAVFFLFAAILFYQRKLWNFGNIALSLGIGVKMSLLLALPGVGVLMGQAMDLKGLIEQATILGAVQLQLALPFVRVNRTAYISRAFEFSRQFLYKWTVNWRFLDEDTFLSKEFSATLLILHASLLTSFALTRWTKASGLTIPSLIRHSFSGYSENLGHFINARLTPTFVTTVIFSSVLLGMACARSLHYQFYAYIAWITPFLLWRANFHPILIYFTWAAQEWAWNVYPSTNLSSLVVIGMLAVQVAGVWWGSRNDGKLPILQKKRVTKVERK